MSAVEFTVFSREGLATVANMSKASSILLFTPVLVPARVETNPSRGNGILDPFESFGRALSSYHKRIRHVPYVPQTGYTDTHAAFLSQSDAIIVVICEPECDKLESVKCQVGFAKQALEAVEGKEAKAPNTFILVQSGSEEHRIRQTASFKNVIEVSTYDDEVANQLAQAIFKFQR